MFGEQAGVATLFTQALHAGRDLGPQCRADDGFDAVMADRFVDQHALHGLPVRQLTGDEVHRAGVACIKPSAR
jgi:hypothetical protein